MPCPPSTPKARGTRGILSPQAPPVCRTQQGVARRPRSGRRARTTRQRPTVRLQSAERLRLPQRPLGPPYHPHIANGNRSKRKIARTQGLQQRGREHRRPRTERTAAPAIPERPNSSPHRSLYSPAPTIIQAKRKQRAKPSRIVLRSSRTTADPIPSIISTRIPSENKIGIRPLALSYIIVCAASTPPRASHSQVRTRAIRRFPLFDKLKCSRHVVARQP